MSTLQQRQLDVSRRCVEAMLDAGSTDLSVSDLLAASGVSRRTFHRWFPSKEQVIRPYFADLSERFAERMNQSGCRSVDGTTAAWAEIVSGSDPRRRLALYRLIRESTEYWATFLEVLKDGERILADSLRRMATPASEREIRVSAVAIVESSRLALDAALTEGIDAADEFRQFLAAFDPPVLDRSD